MQMLSVASSNISKIGYQNGELQVDFLNGSSYVYSNVPRQLFMALVRASSKGKFLHENIKNRFAYNKL